MGSTALSLLPRCCQCPGHPDGDLPKLEDRLFGWAKGLEAVYFLSSAGARAPSMWLLPCSHGTTVCALFLFLSRFWSVQEHPSRVPAWLLISKDSQSLLQTRRTLAVFHYQGHGGNW